MELTRFASINAQAAKHDLSSLYRFVPTMRVVELLASRGWHPSKASEVKTRDVEREGYQKHLIRFRNVTQESIVLRETIFPEIVVTNSHDGRASFGISAGLYRQVCGNGLTVAESQLSTFRVSHIGFSPESIFAAIDGVVNGFPDIASRVNQFSDILLTPDEQGVFAETAAALKYDDAEALRKVSIRRLLSPARREDMAPTLWNTFQTVQEKIIGGGKYLEKERAGWVNRATGAPAMKAAKARGVNSINESQRLNKALWALTEKMAALKTGRA